MKKYLGLLLCFLSILLLTGCKSKKKDIDQILADLKKENIISDSMKQIDTQTYSHWAMEWCSSSLVYIYKDNQSNMIAISYEKQFMTSTHTVTIYYDVTVNDIEYIDSSEAECNGSSSYYSYQGDKYSHDKKYTIDNKKVYNATEKSGIIKGKYFEFELVN